MFAAQITSPSKIELIDVPSARLEKPGQIIFQPSTTCLCGSDLPFFGGAPCGGEEARVPVLAAAEMYGALLAKVREARYDNVSKRAYTTTREKLLVLPRVAKEAWFGN